MKFILRDTYKFFSFIDSREIILWKGTEGEVICRKGDKYKVEIDGWFLDIDPALVQFTEVAGGDIYIVLTAQQREELLKDLQCISDQCQKYANCEECAQARFEKYTSKTIITKIHLISKIEECCNYLAKAEHPEEIAKLTKAIEIYTQQLNGAGK